MSYRRIATEEAFSTLEIYRHYHRLLDSGSFRDPGFESLVGFYLRNPNPRIAEVSARMTDLDTRRIGDMDATPCDLPALSSFQHLMTTRSSRAYHHWVCHA